MRTRLFAIIVAVLCVVMVLLCVPLVLRLREAAQRRRTYNRLFQLYEDRRFEEALPLLEECLALRPDGLELHKLGVNLAQRLEDPELLDTYYQALLESGDEALAAQAHLHLGTLYFRGREGTKPDLDKAIEHFQAALRLDEGLLDARAAIAIAYARKGELDRAQPLLDAVCAAADAGEPCRLAPAARLWRLARRFRRGDALGSWLDYQRLTRSSAVKAQKDYTTPLSLALAFQVGAPGLSSAVRRLCLRAAAKLPDALAAKHGVLLHTLAADARDRLGDEARALREYSQAYKLDPASKQTRRNLAYALFVASAKADTEANRARLFQESTKLYRQLMADGQLDPDEHRTVLLALATRAWNQGRRDEAEALLREATDLQSPIVQRMRATKALEAQDYKAAADALRQAIELDPKQPDAAALLERLSRKPLVRDLRVNRYSSHDARPIICATILPQAVPAPIPKDNVKMLLDGSPVPPIVTLAECFYRPKTDLAPGEHRVEIAITDTLGLSATGAFTFTVDKDEEPPDIVGLAPLPDSETKTLEPIIAFRCTDPSGINSTSLKVTFEGRSARQATRRTVTIIDSGIYRYDFKSLGIARGHRVQAGAGSFQFSTPLAEGECTVQIGVSDGRGNRRVRKWSFKVTRSPDEEPEEDE